MSDAAQMFAQVPCENSNIIINPKKLALFLQNAVLTLMNCRNYDNSDLSLQDLI